MQVALVKSVPHWKKIADNPEPYVRKVMARESVSRWRRRRWREVHTDQVPETPVDGPGDDRLALRQALADAGAAAACGDRAALLRGPHRGGDGAGARDLGRDREVAGTRRPGATARGGGGYRFRMIVAFSISPRTADETGSVSEAVAAAVRVVKESGLPYELNSMFTNVEGEWDEVMAVVKRAVDVVAAVSPRVGLVLKADIRPGLGRAADRQGRARRAAARRLMTELPPSSPLVTRHRRRTRPRRRPPAARPGHRRRRRRAAALAQHGRRARGGRALLVIVDRARRASP